MADLSNEVKKSRIGRRNQWDADIINPSSDNQRNTKLLSNTLKNRLLIKTMLQSP